MPPERRKDTDLEPITTLEQRIEQACAALVRGEDANWELARLTFESTRNGKFTASPGDDRISITEWSERIRAKTGRSFSLSTASRFRQIWNHFGTRLAHEQDRPSWSDAWDWVLGERSSGERFAGTDAKRVIEHVEHIPVETKRALVDALRRDHEVAERIENDFVQRAGQDPVLHSRINHMYQEMNPVPEPPAQPETDNDWFYLMGIGTRIYTAISREQGNVNRLVGRLKTRRETDQKQAEIQELLGTLQRCREMVAQIEGLVEHGAGVDYDQVYRRLVNG